MVSLDTKPLSRMRKNQLGCPYLPSDEFGAFPELLSRSMRILRASLRELCEQARVLAAGASSLPGWASPTACGPARALARPLPGAGTWRDAAFFSAWAFSLSLQTICLTSVAAEAAFGASSGDSAASELVQCHPWLSRDGLVRGLVKNLCFGWRFFTQLEFLVL